MQVPQLIGDSVRMQMVKRVVDKLARSICPVLILGETGTGKEVVARLLHCLAGTGPFVTVDCASLVGTLLESELFGHTRGAYTGAVQPQIGLIEAATGGTAFFDEIGEIPLEFQAKFLRVLQDREFRPVGSVNVRKAQFRLVAATNRDLQRAADSGEFRSDLYYRINVGQIHLPPLRERKEDIPMLVAHFLHKLNTGHTLTPDCLDALMAYSWPGNVRQLENCITRLVAMHTGPTLGRETLPLSITTAGVSDASSRGSMTLLPTGRRTVAECISEARTLSLKDVERRTILDALDQTQGEVGAAARLLGIGRTTLYRKLKEYGVIVCAENRAIAAEL
jgi:DNA-binding NtrC family response regulator